MIKNANLPRRQFLKCGSSLALASLATPLSALAATDTRPTARNLASNQARSVKLQNLHTGEHLNIAYWADGNLIDDNLIQLSQFLRDHRQNEAMLMDPELFDQLWQIENSAGHPCTFEIISGYRSPKTNAMLRAQSGRVARNSYHLRGMALDIRIIGMRTATLRNHAQAQSAGGVGYYPASQFVHIDTGPVRTWIS